MAEAAGSVADLVRGRLGGPDRSRFTIPWSVPT